MIGLLSFAVPQLLDARKSTTMANPKIEQFKKILQLDPKDETLWFGLGKAYMGDNNWAEAIPALEQCIQVRLNYSAAYFALAQSFQQVNNVEKCRSICTEGITVATTNGDLLVIKKSGRTPQFPSLIIPSQ